MEQVSRTRFARTTVSGGRISRFVREFLSNTKQISRWLLTTPLLILAALNVGPDCYAIASDEALEYQVRAAFLLNFTRFIEWPPSAFADGDSPMAICILGDDPFGNIIDQLVSGELVGGRKIVVRRIGNPPLPQTCQVLYIRKTENGNAEAARSGKELSGNLPTGGPGVLTVGEGNAFVREGGMIAFILDTRRVRFDINQTAAENAGLKLSARLLSVARTVVK
jgi:hypothetical protein